MLLNSSELILTIPVGPHWGCFLAQVGAHREESPQLSSPERLPPPSSPESGFGKGNACTRGKAAWLALGREPPPGPTMPGLIPAASIRPGEVGLLLPPPRHAPWTWFWFSGADRSAFL